MGSSKRKTTFDTMIGACISGAVVGAGMLPMLAIGTVKGTIDKIRGDGTILEGIDEVFEAVNDKVDRFVMDNEDELVDATKSLAKEAARAVLTDRVRQQR